jgi:predicted ATP-grasp superfamily ATP-dependent carboligase
MASAMIVKFRFPDEMSIAHTLEIHFFKPMFNASVRAVKVFPTFFGFIGIDIVKEGDNPRERYLDSF